MKIIGGGKYLCLPRIIRCKEYGRPKSGSGGV